VTWNLFGRSPYPGEARDGFDHSLNDNRMSELDMSSAHDRLLVNLATIERRVAETQERIKCHVMRIKSLEAKWLRC
jgi:hypothetical protein